MAKSPELTQAMSALIAQHPFFAVYLLDQMRIKEQDDLPFPAATDGVTIYVRNADMKKWSNKERVFVLAHEVLHGMFQHMGRMKLYLDRGFGPDLKPFNNMKYNKAADYVINDMLVKANVGSMPVGALYNAQFVNDDLVDDVYIKLPDEDDDNEDQWDGHMEMDPNNAPEQADVKRAIKAATNAAKSQGKMPGNIERIVEELIEPKQNWKELLRTAISASLGKDEPTWVRPNRRKLVMAPHVYLPGTTGYCTGKVAVLIDTSGSVSPAELQAFMSETAGILQDGRPEECKVFWTDTKVHKVDEVSEPSELTALNPVGGGGTDLEKAYPVIQDELGHEDVTTIILTDGYTGFTEEPKGMKTIWVTTGYDEIPYGKVIKMDMTHQA